MPCGPFLVTWPLASPEEERRGGASERAARGEAARLSCPRSGALCACCAVVALLIQWGCQGRGHPGVSSRSSVTRSRALHLRVTSGARKGCWRAWVNMLLALLTASALNVGEDWARSPSIYRGETASGPQRSRELTGEGR